MVSELVVFVVFLAAVVAELFHSARVRRVGRLAFGPAGRPRRWTKATPALRVAGLTLFAWGAVTLFQESSTAQSPGRARTAPQRLLLLIDVSPSMYLKDAGLHGSVTRRERANQVLAEVLDEVAANCRISVVVFYDEAKPVVVDTTDRNVVDNILNGLPLAQVFTKEYAETNLFAGLEASFKLVERWPPRSVTLLLVSDGDSVPSRGMPVPPPAIREVVALGIGSTHGRFIAGHSSCQMVAELRKTAGRLRGRYYNSNVTSPAADLLPSLAPRPEESGRRDIDRLVLAQAALVAGGLDLSLVSVLLACAGTAWRPGPRRHGKGIPYDQVAGRSVADDNGGRRRRAVPVVI